jgi:hypothetical protein
VVGTLASICQVLGLDLVMVTNYSVRFFVLLLSI